MERFDYTKFKKEYEMGDIWGLEYLEKTIISDLKEKENKSVDYTKEDFIVSLFYATKELNTCNDIYETSHCGNDFDCDIYFNAKDLLLNELKKYIFGD